MMAGLSELFKLVELFGEEGAFVIPVLLILGLIGAGDTFRRKPGTFCFFISMAFFVTWRVVFSFYQDGSSRYFQMPVILLGAGAVAGWVALFRWSRKISASNWIPVAIVLITVGICIGKSLNPPREKKFIAAVAAYLQKQPEPGVLFDSVAETERFRRLLPAWQFETGARESFQSPLFWRLFFDFFRTGQGAGKDIFVLLRYAPGDSDLTFRRLCEREWGMFPFVSELKIHEKQHQYELFRYRFPTGLFGLPGITRENPNPYRLHVPAELRLRRGERAELRFTAIADSTDLEKWGGVEVNVLYGKADDHAWIFTPDAQTPETFPLEITLYLPNGWPVGHAESLVRVGEVAQLPSVSAESRPVARTPETGPAGWPECLPVPREVIVPDGNEIKLHLEQAKTYPEAKAPETPPVRKISVRPLSGPVFWIGSRAGGSNDVTTRLRQKHPELQFYRLEEHPVLPSSKDPRYTFEDLTGNRHDNNPLLDSRGNVSWQDYRRREQLPDFPVIVLALGYEEVLSGERTGFKMVPGIKALETFAEALAKASPQTRILVVLPIPPSQQPEKYGDMIFNRYNYPFRRGPWLAYCRLVREVTAVGEKNSNVTVLPTYLLVKSGSVERDPAYLQAIEAYLQLIHPQGNP